MDYGDKQSNKDTAHSYSLSPGTTAEFSSVLDLCSCLSKGDKRANVRPDPAVKASGRAATPAAGRLPALHLQSRHPPLVSWLLSLVSPSEAPVGPYRMHLQERINQTIKTLQVTGSSVTTAQVKGNWVCYFMFFSQTI